jgi:hypothetical protein
MARRCFRRDNGRHSPPYDLGIRRGVPLHEASGQASVKIRNRIYLRISLLSFPGSCPEHYPYAGSLDTGHMFHINAMHTSNTAKPKYAGNIRGA